MQIFTTLIDADALLEALDDPHLRVVDCRHSLADPEAGVAAWQAEHIPGAAHAHIDRDLSGEPGPQTGRHPLPDTERLDEFFSTLGIAPTTQVVAYDDLHGAFASRLWWLLRWRGHERVAVLNGGIAAWRAAGYPLEQDWPRVRAAKFRSGTSLEEIAPEELVEAIAAGDSRLALVDARAPERFAGKEEPVDPVAGHIPNAINRPFIGNVRQDGSFVSVEELGQRFPPGGSVHMCGSGVTACHNILAMRHAGRSDGRLYPGSWSEWIRKPEHPVMQAASNTQNTRDTGEK